MICYSNQFPSTFISIFFLYLQLSTLSLMMYLVWTMKAALNFYLHEFTQISSSWIEINIFKFASRWWCLRNGNDIFFNLPQFSFNAVYTLKWSCWTSRSRCSSKLLQRTDDICKFRSFKTSSFFNFCPWKYLFFIFFENLLFNDHYFENFHISHANPTVLKKCTQTFILLYFFTKLKTRDTWNNVDML